jgi:hypothetical protein
MFYPRLLALSVTVLLSACSDSDTKTTPDDQTTTLPQLNDIKVSTSPLAKASADQFATNLKNGLFVRRYSSSTLPPASGDQSNEMSATTSGNFSTTNQQESGVDEADRVKYDGQYMYIAANGMQNITDTQTSTQYVRIMKRDDSGALTPVKQLSTSDIAYQKQQLYLHDNTLAVLNHDYGWFGILEPMAAASTSVVEGDILPVPTSQQFELSVLDVSQPEQAANKAHFVIDGQLIDSRVIGDHLYLVSNYYPHFDNFSATDGDDQSKLRDYQALQKEQISNFIPKITNTTTEQTTPLFEADDCYISADATNVDGFDAIMTVTKIALDDPSQRSSICVNSQIDGLYASTKSLYTYSTQYFADKNQSVIHKFDLEKNEPNYSATGLVSGHLGWNNANLRFSEMSQHLRLVTSNGNSLEGFEHTLYVLEQQGDKLNVVSQLPNEQFPTPIGKVNEKGIVDEDVYAVRFTDQQAYVVTFKQTDPLYVIDLSDALNPKIAGALEIPGYSAYLHPVSDGLLLGVGQHVEDIASDTPVVSQGAKVSLFDISDISAPKELSAHTFEGAYTAAENDYHAFSFLSMSNGQYRFTLPIETWHSTSTEPSFTTWTRSNELALFALDINSKQLSYSGSSPINYPDDKDNLPYVWSGDDRAVIHQDDVYYIHGNYVWQSTWQAPAKNAGPY